MSRQPLPLLSIAWNELPVWRVHDIQALVITCTVSGALSKSLQNFPKAYKIPCRILKDVHCVRKSKRETESWIFDGNE